MQLIVSKLAEFYHGLMVSVKEGNEIDDIAIVNGNKENFLGPILLLDIDQEVVYGMSHRKVVSRIYAKGPQILLTTKELGHRLFEHGMKAALGKTKVGNVQYLTNLETYYTVHSKYGFLELTISEGRLGCYVKPRENYEPILLTTGAFKDKTPLATHSRIDIDKIQTEVTRKFKLRSRL